MMKHIVIALFAVFAATSAGAQVGTVSTPAAGSIFSVLPAPPLITKIDVENRCSAWFKTKVEYTGTIAGQGSYTLQIWTENAEMAFGRISNRWICKVKYSAWNLRQEGSWNVQASFDGNAVMWIDPKYSDPGIASVLALSADGNTISFSRRFRNSDGSFGTSAGSFNRK